MIFLKPHVGMPFGSPCSLEVSCQVKKQKSILGKLIFLFTVAATSFFGPHAVAAQNKQDAHPLLQVTTQGLLGLDRSCKTGEGLIVQLHYSGTKALRGYLLTFNGLDDGAGENIGDGILEEAHSLREPQILGGQDWTRIICRVPPKVLKDPTSLSAKVDVLKFADGSIWGPGSLIESHELIGKIDGMDFIDGSTELKKFVSPILPGQAPTADGIIESQTIGPLKFDSGTWRDERGRDKLVVRVTNVSDSAIRGYLFTITFFDPQSGATIRRVSTKELETQGDPSGYLAPGLTWAADSRRFSYLADGSLAKYRFTLDLVVFANGSIAGPLHSQESAEVLGMFSGIDDANRARHASIGGGKR